MSIPIYIAAAALVYSLYLFYRFVIVPEQQYKQWRREKQYPRAKY